MASPDDAQTNRRLEIGYPLYGFGFSLFLASALVMGVLFKPPRGGGPAMVPFRWDHPAFIVSAIGVTIGGGMLATGLHLVRAAQRRQAEAAIKASDPEIGAADGAGSA